jgi:hypothetical protein
VAIGEDAADAAGGISPIQDDLVQPAIRDPRDFLLLSETGERVRVGNVPVFDHVLADGEVPPRVLVQPRVEGVSGGKEGEQERDK